RIGQAAGATPADIPAALGSAIAESLPQENSVAPWWRAVAAWQGLLLGAAVLGVAWLLAIIILGGFGGAPHAAPLLSDVSLLPWVALLGAAGPLPGRLAPHRCTAVVCPPAGHE